MFILECIALGLGAGWVLYRLAVFDQQHRDIADAPSHVRRLEFVDLADLMEVDQ